MFSFVLQSVCQELDVEDVEKIQSKVRQLIMDSESLPHLKQVTMLLLIISLVQFLVRCYLTVSVLPDICLPYTQTRDLASFSRATNTP